MYFYVRYGEKFKQVYSNSFDNTDNNKMPQITYYLARF